MFLNQINSIIANIRANCMLLLSIIYMHEVTIRSIQYIFHQCACLEEVGPPQLLWFTGHHEFNSWSLRQLTARTKSEENKSFKPNQIALSIYIMIELYFISLDQWEKKIHLLRGKCFNIILIGQKPLDQCEIATHSRASSLWPSFKPNQI